jgi:hypothetical protein
VAAGIGAAVLVVSCSPGGSSGPPARRCRARERRWRSPACGPILGRNGRTLTLRFVGAAAGTGSCTADCRAELAQSRSAVAVVLHEQDHGSGACATVGYQRQVTTVLPSALGGRVLVDAATDTAIPVTKAG